jgi:hypothetical protein
VLVLRAGALLLALLVPAAALAQPATTPALGGADLLAALRAGRHVLYFRHADTDHSQNDQRMTSVEDCTTQRNLSEQGREHARAILAFGAARKSPAVREDGPLPPGRPGRFPALRALLSTSVAPGTNTVVVGHAYPYYTLVGGQYLSEGEADVLRPRGADFEVVARVGLAQWRALAAVPAGR